MMAPRPTGVPARGFTLIEVAVVVTIIAALMSLGLGFLNSQITSNAYLLTKKRSELVKEALIAHLGTHRRLPCPIVPSGVVTGIAPLPSGSPLACPTFGVIPYATLGLSREIAEDGWGNLFSYQVHSEAAPTCPGIGRNWGVADCFGEGKEGALTVNDGTLAAPTTLTSTAIAAVISHGPNGLGAYVVQGTRNADPTRCEEAQNAHIGITATPACPTLPAPESYVYFKGERAENDDVVAYFTATEAMQTLARYGVLKPATGRANDDLQILYDQTIGLNMGAACTTTAPAPLPFDPWGEPYTVEFNSTPTDPNFRICICTRGGTGTKPSAATCLPTAPAMCKSMDQALFLGYRAKAGAPACS